MPCGVQQSGAAPDAIRLDPNPPQPRPGVQRSILGDHMVEPAPSCGPRNPVLRALRYLDGLLSRAFAAVKPCGARRVSTPESAAEQTRRNRAPVIDRERTAVKRSLRAAIELIGRRGTDDKWIKQSILDVARKARRRCSRLQKQGLVADVDAAVRDFMASAADRDFDRMFAEQINRGLGPRALRLLRELRGSQRVVPVDRALGDTEWLRQRLEATVSDAIVKREINIIKKNLRAAAEAVAPAVRTRQQAAAEITQKFNEVTRDGLERCRKLEKLGLITDVNATLLACMPPDMREPVAPRMKAPAAQVPTSSSGKSPS
jgi:hypothetical protein